MPSIPPLQQPDVTSEGGSVPPRREHAVTAKSVLLALFLLPINALWVVQMEMVRYSAHPTTVSLFFNTVFILLCLTLLNRVATRFAPRWALCRGELLLVYSILCIGSCVCGHDFLQVFVPLLTWSFRHADDSNNWATLFNPHLKPGFFISDPHIYSGFYVGGVSIFRPDVFRAWLPVVLAWTSFFSLMLFVMLCINAILRKQWTENEKLTYPIIQLPLLITDKDAFDTKGLFRNKVFWIGFLIAASIDTINSLNYYYPWIPTVLTPGFGQSYVDIGVFFREKPWSAVGWTPISFYPFVIGIGMFMPLDFLFSCFFFYWFWKLQHVTATVMAWDYDPRFPYTESQSFGAYFSFCLYSMWVSRRYLVRVVQRAFGKGSALDDRREAMSYRSALLGLVAGIGGLTLFASYLGMKWWVGICFFLIYFGLAVAILRMRAELGTPIHDLHYTGPEQTMTRVLGSRSFDPSTLTVSAIFFGFNRAYRGHPAPHQLEAYKMAEQTGGEYRKWHATLLILGSVAVFIGFWTILQQMYAYGAEGKSFAQIDTESLNFLTTQLQSPERGKPQELMAIVVGAGFAFLLQWLRLRFPWWPLHPLAYAVTSSWEINLVWMPLTIAWIVKSLILRYGGRGGFHRALPFFIGIILGQFVVGSLWNIYGIWQGLPTYQFWQ